MTHSSAAQPDVASGWATLDIELRTNKLPTVQARVGALQNLVRLMDDDFDTVCQECVEDYDAALLGLFGTLALMLLCLAASIALGLWLAMSQQLGAWQALAAAVPGLGVSAWLAWRSWGKFEQCLAEQDFASVTDELAGSEHEEHFEQLSQYFPHLCRRAGRGRPLVAADYWLLRARVLEQLLLAHEVGQDPAFTDEAQRAQRIEQTALWLLHAKVAHLRAKAEADSCAIMVQGHLTQEMLYMMAYHLAIDPQQLEQTMSEIEQAVAQAFEQGRLAGAQWSLSKTPAGDIMLNATGELSARKWWRAVPVPAGT